jgi:hypothetical protein
MTSPQLVTQVASHLTTGPGCPRNPQKQSWACQWQAGWHAPVSHSSAYGAFWLALFAIAIVLLIAAVSRSRSTQR